MPSAAIIGHWLNGWGPPNSLQVPDIDLIARPEHVLEWAALADVSLALVAAAGTYDSFSSAFSDAFAHGSDIAVPASPESPLSLVARADSGVSVT